MSLEEVIQLWREITEKFEHEHPGFRVNFIICTLKHWVKRRFSRIWIFSKNYSTKSKSNIKIVTLTLVNVE